MKNLMTCCLFFCAVIAMHAQTADVFEIAKKGTVLQMQELLAKNPEMADAANSNGSTPLILAAYYANEAVALWLCDQVKDINYHSGRGTALMAAVMSGNAATIAKLLAKKANPDITDTDGKTALMYAVYFNKDEIAKLLVDNGANKQNKDREGKTALDIARFNKNTKLIILLDQ